MPLHVPLKDERLLRQKCYVAGAWVDASDGKTVAVLNPATGTAIGTVPKGGAAEARRAIEAAQVAWPAWRKRTAKDYLEIKYICLGGI
ncbi:MAG TPA: aldehyde dehydrogenase family protein [Anaeromyxobacter sp.]